MQSGLGFIRPFIAEPHWRADFELAIKAEHEVTEFLEEHRLVAEAINDRDPDGARSRMRNLLHNNECHLTEMRAALSSGDPAQTDG